MQQLLSELWANCNNRREQLGAVKSQLAAQDKAIDDLEKGKVFLLSQKEFIQKMQAQYQDSPDPVVEGRFIAQVRPTDTQTGIIGKIKHVNVIPANETSAEQYEITYETKYVALDLQYMDERIAVIEVKLAEGLSAKADLEARIQEQSWTVEGDLKQIQDQEKKLSVLESQKHHVEAESGKLVGELDMITNEFAEIESTLATLKVQEQELSKAIDDIAAALTRCQNDIKDKQEAIAAKSQERETLNVTIAQMEAEYGAVADKQHGLRDQEQVYTSGLDRDLADISRFENDVQELQSKKARVSEEIVSLTQTIEQFKTQKEALALEFNDNLAQKAEMSQRLSSVRNQSRAIEDEIINAKSDMHNLQMKEQELQFAQRALKERLLQAYKINWDEIVALPLLPAPEAAAEGEAIAATPAPEVNYDELAIEIDRLKKRCESYGAVNLVAIEEFEELKGRYEFLTKQQSDLLTAREQLMSTIQKINRTTRQMFTETFAKVSEEFTIYFRMLFGGGEAQLVLLDPENALECGIDIVARPPGKKLQNISLLSGGEKTLTAIALIFGVFKVNPSPFCVLDEIDAALDESNVGRFANLLKEFAKIAQFVVITHNKKTMAVADVMYGVTMQERGVSRIVSVKFNEYQGQPQIAQSKVQHQPQELLPQSPNGATVSDAPQPSSLATV